MSLEQHIWFKVYAETVSAHGEADRAKGRADKAVEDFRHRFPNAEMSKPVSPVYSDE